MQRLRDKFLIVTADDFGLHEAVNEGIERASRFGVLTSASLMMGAPATDDAVRRARMLPRLRVGLHLVLADGTALLAPHLIPALADAGGRMDDRMGSRGVRFFAFPSVRRQVEAEVRAQFSAFVRTGLNLDHVNVHKHFHLHPTILSTVLRVGREYGMSAVRVPDEPLWFAARDNTWLAAASNAALKPWVALMKRRLDAAGVRHNDAIFGIAASGALTEAKLLAVIARLPPGVTEIYMHPAVETARPITASMNGYRHAEELAAVLSTHVRAAVAASGAGLGGFGDAEGRARGTSQ